MNWRILLILIPFLLVGAIGINSCESGFDPEYSFYRIPVDSIQVPSSLEAGQPFEIRFYGVVGTDGCHQFSRFQTVSNPDKIGVEVMGRRTAGDGIACADVMVYLEGRALEFTVDQPGTYILEIRQPEGDPIRKTIRVKES